MADITNLSSFLGDVADAIRSKKGSEESIPAKKFDEEILSIETGIDTSDADATEENIEKGKTAYVNGLKVTGTLADAGGSADIMVSVDNISVGNQRGWDCVSTKYTNSGKKIHKDGWYVNQHMKFEDLAPVLGVTSDKIAKGNTILGVEGTAEAGNGAVKLFETEEEMQADTTAEEGDLAVVYRDESQKITKDSILSDLTFPEVVTLSEAITSSSNCIYRDEDRNYMYRMVLNASSCYLMEQYELGYIARYSSTDGITYTRTTTNDSCTLPTPASYYSGTWRDAYGEFMLSGGKLFNGLFEYKTYVTSDLVTLRTLNTNETKQTIKLPDISQYVKNSSANTAIFIKNIIAPEEFDYKTSYLIPSEYYVVTTSEIMRVVKNGSGDYKLGINSNVPSATDYYRVIHIVNDVVESDIERLITDTTDWSQIAYNSSYNWNSTTSATLPDINNCFFAIYTLNAGYSHLKVIEIESDFPTDTMNGTVYYGEGPLNDIKYFIAPTQLTLNNSNQLLPEQIAYGKNGIIEGDGTIYDNLAKTNILTDIYGLVPSDTDWYSGINKDTDLILAKESNYADDYKLHKLIADSTSPVAVSVPKDKIRYLISNIISIKDLLPESSFNIPWSLSDVILSDDGKTLGLIRKGTTDRSYIIDLENHVLLKTFTTHHVKLYKHKVFYATCSLSGTAYPSDSNYYCYDLNTRTNTVVATSSTSTADTTYQQTVVNTYGKIIAIMSHKYASASPYKHEYDCIFLDCDTHAKSNMDTISWSDSLNYSSALKVINTNDGVYVMISSFHGTGNPRYNYCVKCDLSLNVTTLVNKIKKINDTTLTSDSTGATYWAGCHSGNYVIFGSNNYANLYAMNLTTGQFIKDSVNLNRPMSLTANNVLLADKIDYHIITGATVDETNSIITLTYDETKVYLPKQSGAYIEDVDGGTTVLDIVPENVIIDETDNKVQTRSWGAIITDTCELRLLSETQSDEYDYIVINISTGSGPRLIPISNGVITPTEYEEINAIAEDVLGGVE